ncbi:MAG: DnaJ domain-containing protein [Paludibacteraceae bacterium]|nr:DnaJ domain-containing protein [Paludibacteraceae bacterium]
MNDIVSSVVIVFLYFFIYGGFFYWGYKADKELIINKAKVSVGLFTIILKYNCDYNPKVKALIHNYVKSVCGDNYKYISNVVDEEVMLLLKKRNLNIHKRSFDAREFLEYKDRVALVKLLFDIAIQNEGIYPAELEVLKIIMERTIKQSDYDRFLDEYKKYFVEYKSSSTLSSTPSQRLIDAYAVLGLKPNTSYEEIKRTYRYLMFKNHPDRFEKGDKGQLEEAVAKAKEINIAYNIIKDSLNL